MFNLVSTIILFFSFINLAFASENTVTEPDIFPSELTIKVGIVGQAPALRTLDDTVVNRDLELNHTYIKSIFSQLNYHSAVFYYSSYDELFNALKMHQIDVAYGAYGNKYLTPNLVESKTVYQKLTTVWSKEKDFHHIKNATWGCIDGSVFCDKLEEDSEYNIIKAPNFLSLWQMLKNGSLDAIASSYTNVAFNYNHLTDDFGYIKILPKSNAQDVRFITNKQNIKLINELNDNIKISNGSLVSNDVYQSISNLLIDFDDNYEIKYSVPFDSYPFFYIHDAGVADGYLVDMLSYIEDHTGVTFTFIPLKHGASAVSLLDKGEVDAIPIVKGFIDNNKDYIYSKPFFSFKFVALYKEAENVGKKISQQETGVLFSDSATYQRTKKMLFGENSKLYTSIDSLLDDVNKSQIKKAYVRDGLVGYSLTQQANNQYFVDRNDTVNLIISMVLGAKNKDKQELFNLFFSVVDKVEVEHFKTKYTPFSLTYGYNKQVTNVIFVLGFVLVLLVVYVIWLRYKTLKIKVKYQDEAAEKTRSDIDFLQNVIDAIPGAVRIYNQHLSPVMSNIGEDGTLTELITKVEDSNDIAHVLSTGCTTHREITLNNRVWRCLYKKIDHPMKNEKMVLIDILEVTQDKEKEAQLLKATEAAQTAVIARQQFLATMSHELRTPIAGMVGLLEILKKHLNTEESRIITNNIIASSRHLHLLVNDILDYSKLEAGKLKLELRECSLSRELNELFRIHCVAARQKGLQFKLRWNTDNVKIVQMDPLRMSQIFNNLLSNAVKFTHVGSIDVAVDAYETYFTFTVTDSGEGMSSSVIEHVFEPFKQADSSIARRFGGTGLGLSIVKSLVDVIGGDIEIDSDIGRGTKITVTLPYQKVRGFENLLSELDIRYHGYNPVVMQWISMWQTHAKQTNNRKRVDIVFDSELIKQRDNMSENIILISEKCKEFKRARDGLIELSLTPLFPDLLFDTLHNIEAAQDNETKQDLKKLEGNILVAEDNAINRMVFKTQLSSMGLSCHIVENGHEALTMLMSQPDDFDLLITDCHMPVMDGYELSKKVRELIPQFNKKAIIGCTAEDLRVNQEREELIHFDQVLYKPYGLTGLHEALTQYLKGKEVDTVNFWREHFGDEAELMASVFVESMTGDIARLKDAENNISTQKQIIHKIKGGAAAVGIDEIFEIAGAIEHATLIEGSMPKDKLNQLIKCTENYINKAQLMTDLKRVKK